MVREIVRSEEFLSVPSEAATPDDAAVADDLLDTLRANADRCVGMAANMIGVRRCIIVFNDNGTLCEMFNPVILSGKDRYRTAEGCLSLDGQRTTIRYKTVRVQWQNRQFQTRIKTFSGYTAEIIQHEIDHCLGKII